MAGEWGGWVSEWWGRKEGEGGEDVQPLNDLKEGGEELGDGVEEGHCRMSVRWGQL